VLVPEEPVDFGGVQSWGVWCPSCIHDAGVVCVGSVVPPLPLSPEVLPVVLLVDPSWVFPAMKCMPECEPV
jgi:hypothetical protein